jgi:hypothetical protein
MSSLKPSRPRSSFVYRSFIAAGPTTHTELGAWRFVAQTLKNSFPAHLRLKTEAARPQRAAA